MKSKADELIDRFNYILGCIDHTSFPSIVDQCNRGIKDAEAIRQAIAEEREACAKACENLLGWNNGINCASVIRQRTGK